MIAGRWLEPQDEKSLVISDSIYNQYPDLQPGDTLQLNIGGGRTEEWPVVGIFQFVDMAWRFFRLLPTLIPLPGLTNTPGVASTYPHGGQCHNSRSTKKK